MRLYDRYYQSNYDELITYYPRYYRDVFEMREILKAFGRIIDRLEGHIEQTYLNNFIDYADAATISELEKFLGIGLGSNRDLDARKRYVKAFFVGSGKVSASMIREMLSTYTEAAVDIAFAPCDEAGNNQLVITCHGADNGTFKLSDIKPLLASKLPAHILYLLVKSNILEMDFSDWEKMDSRAMRIHIPLSFWNYRSLDGGFLLNGEYLLDAMHCYYVRAGIKYGLGVLPFTEKTDAQKARLAFPQELQENIRPQVKLKGEIYFWQTARLNGEYLLDGMTGLGEARQQAAKMALAVNTKIQQQETFTGAGVEMRRNEWYLNGENIFADGRLLNSYHEKEAI